MTLSIQLDRQAGQALYQQIAAQVRNQINRGQLPPGARLPAVRRLAQDLKVTRLTVHNAYSELQAGGWVESTVGRGTFVSTAIRPQALMGDIGQQLTPEGVMQAMAPISRVAGLHSLAYAFPDTALLPAADFGQELTALQADRPALMQYGSPQGDPLLRVELAALLHKRGVVVTPDEIVVTSGVTQGLALITQALTRPGDVVLVEQPTYHGFLSILKAQGVGAIGVPLDQNGLHLDTLKRLIAQHGPRFFYTIPNFHNPTGYCMPEGCRQELLGLAARYGLLLVEDDTYGLLSYQGQPPAPLKGLDPGETVIYVGGLSKALMPGLRTGYVLAPPALRRHLLTLRLAADLFSPPLLERALANFLKKKKLTAHLRRVLPVYRARRDALLQGLERWMPPVAAWTRPQGAFSCWLSLPPDERLDDLYQAALNRGVAYTPGAAFLTEAERQPHLRLCFGNQPVEVIQESVMMLGGLIQERLSAAPPHDLSAHDWIPPV